MDDLYLEPYQCVNECNVFWVVGVPSHCPFCGTSELTTVDEDATMYDNIDKVIENNGT